MHGKNNISLVVLIIIIVIVVILAVLWLFSFNEKNTHKHRVIVVKDSIQEAINRARPGDTIKIPAGTYVTTPAGGDVAVSVPVNLYNLTIIGEEGAILDATGFATGILVSPVLYDYPTPDNFVVPEIPCPPLPGIRNFTLRGLTIKNASQYGVHLVNADGFDISHNTFQDNLTYGIFPICSRNGVISHNSVSGSLTDAAIYVGDSHHVSVHHNHASNSAIALEIENCTKCQVQYNELDTSAVGLLVHVNVNLPVKEDSEILVANNDIHDNNLIAQDPDFGKPGVEVEQFLTPSGIVINGGGPVVVINNKIYNNNTVGFVAIDLPEFWWGGTTPRDPALFPQRFSFGITFTQNTMFNNGAVFGTPQIDFIFATNGNISDLLCIDNTNSLSSGQPFLEFAAIQTAVISPPGFQDSVTIAPPDVLIIPQTTPCPIPKWARKHLRLCKDR